MQTVKTTRRQHGFTLIEMMISLLILGVASLLATQLLLESQSRVLNASERLLEPAMDLAVKQLRADLQTCSGAGGSVIPGLWNNEPLPLNGHPAGLVTYQKIDGDFVRLMLKDPTDPATVRERLILKDVTTFRWRLHGSSIEIDLAHRPTGRLRQQTASGRWREPARRDVERVFQITPRGAGGRSW